MKDPVLKFFFETLFNEIRHLEEIVYKFVRAIPLSKKEEKTVKKIIKKMELK